MTKYTELLLFAVFGILTVSKISQKVYLTEVLLMSNHNICFCAEIKIYHYFLLGKSALSGAIVLLT